MVGWLVCSRLGVGYLNADSIHLAFTVPFGGGHALFGKVGIFFMVVKLSVVSCHEFGGSKISRGQLGFPHVFSRTYVGRFCFVSAGVPLLVRVLVSNWH